MAMLQDMRAMKPELVDDPADTELEFWGLKTSARLDISCTDLEHLKTVVVRELHDLADRIAKICRDDQEKVVIRLRRVQQSIRFSSAEVKLTNRNHTKSSDST